MTSTEVNQALERYEAELRRIDAPVVPHLAPGISDTGIRQLEQRYGVKLPEPVRTIWRWHNGIRDSDSARADDARRMLVPGRAFGDLKRSLAFAREFSRLAAEGNPQSDFAGRPFVSLLIGNIGVLVDLTPGAIPLTYVNDPMSWSLTDYPSMPIADRVDSWTRALRSGAWRINTEGKWVVEPDRYPDRPERSTL